MIAHNGDEPPTDNCQNLMFFKTHRPHDIQHTHCTKDSDFEVL